jgi:hypothetical protein
MSDAEREAWQRAYVIAANAVRLAISGEQNVADELTPMVCEALRQISSELERTSHKETQK